MINSERDDRLGSLEVSAVAVVGNLRSTVLLRTSRNDRVGDRGTPEVEGQAKGSVESSEKACCESEQSPLTMCTGNGLTDVEASDSVCNVERSSWIESPAPGHVWTLTISVFKEMFKHLSQ